MVNKNKPIQKKKDISVGKLILVIVLIIFGAFVVFSFLSNSYNSSDGSLSSSESKIVCRDAQVPYDYQEEYTETVPYTDQECESRELVYKKDTGSCIQRDDNFFADDVPAKYSCTITNLDTEAGTFSMKIGFNVNGEQLFETQQKYIYPQSSESFSVSRDASISSCFCSETSIPTKQVCRDVIKYKDVAKYRTITKYKTEQQCS